MLKSCFQFLCVLQNGTEQSADWVIQLRILHVSRRLEGYIINEQPY